MTKIKPISPTDQLVIRNDNMEVERAIRYINNKIEAGMWHKQIIKKEGYKAILISPYGTFSNDIMRKVVELFKAEGWDCFYSHARDARGPHDCFYLSEKHFNEK